jgi:hypothetical protein
LTASLFPSISIEDGAECNKQGRIQPASPAWLRNISSEAEKPYHKVAKENTKT